MLKNDQAAKGNTQQNNLKNIYKKDIWTFAKTQPLSCCCYILQAMVVKSCSHVKNTSLSKEKTDNVPTYKTEQVTFGIKLSLY